MCAWMNKTATFKIFPLKELNTARPTHIAIIIVESQETARDDRAVLF